MAERVNPTSIEEGPASTGGTPVPTDSTVGRDPASATSTAPPDSYISTPQVIGTDVPRRTSGFHEDLVYFGGPIDPSVHADDTPGDIPDVYVNGEDLTVTVDPIKNLQWVLPHNAERHSFTAKRGALKDHKGVLDTQRLLDDRVRYGGDHFGYEAADNFVPTTGMLDGLPKFSPKCVANSTRGPGMNMNRGELPAITDAIYKNQLRDVPDWFITEELRMANTHLDRTRFFDIGGARGCR